MSGLSQKRAFTLVLPMSALPPKADMVPRDRDVRFVPEADIRQVQQSDRLPAGHVCFRERYPMCSSTRSLVPAGSERSRFEMRLADTS